MSKEVKLVGPSWSFDPIRDIAPVEQFGFIDLVAANHSSSVPGAIESEDSKFNGIEDPAAIAGRPRDIFEQAQGNKVIAGFKAPETNSEGVHEGE